jgi:hypothetical protein
VSDKIIFPTGEHITGNPLTSERFKLLIKTDYQAPELNFKSSELLLTDFFFYPV